MEDFAIDTGFRPLPFLGNAHVQTLLGNIPERRGYVQSRLRVAPLPDRDRLALHDSVPPRWNSGDPIAVLLHGLGGCHRSGYMQRTAVRLMERGWRVVRMDLRGVGSGASLARKTYYGGCSEDARAAAEEIHRWSPASPISFVGFSLGGNIALKLAGEAADRPVAGLASVAAFCPPIDLTASAAMIALPQNRFYERYFLRHLVEQVTQQRRRFPELPRPEFPKPLTMRLFDDAYTAPTWGFADALDYYGQSSAVGVIPRIKVPSFILTARDDPFIPAAPFENLRLPGHVEMHIAQRGGHMGFLGWNNGDGVRWAEARICEWLTRPPIMPR